MPKGCPKCGTQNDDAAVFCRGCGSTFATAEPESEEHAGVTCSACGHSNRVSASFCAKCGNDLSEQTIIRPRPKPVAPPLPPPSSPDWEQTAPPSPPLAYATPPAADTSNPFGPAETPNRTVLLIGLAVLVIAVLAGGVWWFSTRSGTEPAAAQVAPPHAVTAPVVAAPASAPPVVAVPASAPPVVAQPATPAASETALPVNPAPAAAAVSPVDTGDALRAAQEQATRDLEARDKEAKDKATRDAKAKALRDKREAAVQAERDAARQRAEEQRSRPAPAAQRAATPAPTPAAPAPAPAPVARTARDICAGGNVITRSVCESRECGRAEHAEEPACKQVNAAEARRRQSQN